MKYRVQQHYLFLFAQRNHQIMRKFALLPEATGAGCGELETWVLGLIRRHVLALECSLVQESDNFHPDE
jgi:hypothetical protein